MKGSLYLIESRSIDAFLVAADGTMAIRKHDGIWHKSMLKPNQFMDVLKKKNIGHTLVECEYHITITKGKKR